jgi:hypothetical protein
MSQEARRQEFLDELRLQKARLTADSGASQMPRPLIDGVASFIAADTANQALAETFRLSALQMDDGEPLPLAIADIDAAITALEAMGESEPKMAGPAS